MVQKYWEENREMLNKKRRDKYKNRSKERELIASRIYTRTKFLNNFDKECKKLFDKKTRYEKELLELKSK